MGSLQSHLLGNPIHLCNKESHRVSLADSIKSRLGIQLVNANPFVAPVEDSASPDSQGNARVVSTGKHESVEKLADTVPKAFLELGSGP